MSTQTVTIFGTLLVIISTCFHSIEGLEGRLFYLSFMNLSTVSPYSQLGIQEIFIASSKGGRVKIQYHSPHNYTEDIIELNSTNNFQYAKRIMPQDLASPPNSLLNLAIVVSSEMDISVQANKAEPATGDGYLALPITEQSVSFFLASYSSFPSPWTSMFSIASPFNDTRISISYVRGTTGHSLMNLTMQANDVYQTGSSSDFDYTGVYVASSKPIAVYSGHVCADVPVNISFCDHIVEQVPPVTQWGTLFIMASFYRRPWAVRYRIRVIAQADTNVTYTFQLFDAKNNPGTWSIFRRVTLVRGGWDEAPLENITATNAVVVMVNCTFNCLVMQYNPGFQVLGDDGPGEIAKPDPFMITVPPLNHYPQNVRFSTSRQYNGASDYECVNGITIVAKTIDINMGKIYLDGIPLISIGGTTYVINADGYSDYSVIIAPLTPGFHSVTSNDPNSYYAVFVYGYGTQSYTAYGYLGGYRYLPTTCSSAIPSSSSEYDPNCPPSQVTMISDDCPVIQLGIGLGVSCGVILLILLGIIMCLCVKIRSLERYKRESQPKSQSQVITHSQNGRPNHPATEIAVVQSSSSSNHYETPLTEIPHREYERIGPHNRVITAERESTRFYDNSLH